MSCQRGSLIALEGDTKDCCTSNFNEAEGNSTILVFPDSELGFVSTVPLSGAGEGHAQHLLVSAGRWERVPEILAALHSGKNVIIFNWAYNGAASSAAKVS